MTQLQRGRARTLAERHTATLVELQRLREQILALRDEQLPYPVRHPGRGRAVIACACGRVLDARDMVRIVVPHGGPGVESAPGIARIGCSDCAAEAAAAVRRSHANPPAWSA